MCEMDSRKVNGYSSSSARESFSEASFLTKAERTLILVLISSSFRDSKVLFLKMDSSLLQKVIRHCWKVSFGGDGVKGVPLQFLGNIVVRLLYDLLHNAGVSFGFLTESGGLIKNGSTNISGGIDELLSEVIQGWNAPGQVIETTSNGAMGTTLLVQEINKRLFIATTIVSNRICLAIPTLPEELDSGKG